MNDYFPPNDVLNVREIGLKNFLFRRIKDIQEYKNKVREREQKFHFQKFQKKLEDSDKYLFFVHNFLPYKDFPIGGVYYELLIFLDKSYKSYCSAYYEHDNPQNRIYALENFYKSLNMMFDIRYTKQEQWEIQEKERNYSELYGKFINTVCNRLFNEKKISKEVNVVISTDSKKQWIELNIHRLNKSFITYYSKSYDVGILNNKHEYYKARNSLYVLFLKDTV